MFLLNFTSGILILASLCTITYGRPQKTFSGEDYTYIEKYNSYYKFHSEELSWGQSKAKCESEGATLYYPESEAEVRDVTALLNVWSGGGSIYTGISSLEEREVYKTIDGRPINEVYHKWFLNEPNSGYNHKFRCVVLWHDFTLQVHYCENSGFYRRFICKTPIIAASVEELSSPQNTPGGAVLRQDYTYVEKYNSYYKFHNEKLGWGASKAKCESEGATLYYPESEAEARDVTALLHVWSGGVGSIYTGISDLEELGVYKTIDGRPISEVYHKWSPYEPLSGPSNEYRCVILWKDFTFEVHHCEDSSFYRPFVCKTPRNAVQELRPTQNTHEGPQGALSDKEYTYMEKYNNYYKFHSEMLSWGESKAKCESEGATLYYPESEAEARDVTALLHVWSENVDWINVGISDLEQLGVYKTIDGKPVSEVYNKWKPNEPNSGPSNIYRCVNLWDDFLLQVHLCDSLGFYRAFICKKPKVNENNSETTTELPQQTTKQELSTPPNNDECERVCGEGEGGADSSSVFFGRTVGEELRRLPARARLRAMVGITRVLKEESRAAQDTSCHTSTLTNG